MNHDEHRLKRLFKAARQSPPETSASIPLALETRIIARWHSSAPEEQLELLSLAGLFRRAAVCAVLVMVASVGWNQLSDAREVPGVMAFSNLATDIQVVP